ncbi:MAG: hypothetical protein R3B72_36485 [Polyangiaceae bacterium]
MKHDTQPSRILVTGGTGKTGARVARRLAAHGHTVRVASRSTPLPFDWQRPGTWAPVLEGQQTAYLAYAPDLVVPGAVEQVGRFAEHARRDGVEHLVLLAGRGEDAAMAAEEAVKATGPGFTILRASWFAQNFSEGAFVEPLRQGRLELPVAAIGEPFIDVDDVADVAAEVITSPRKHLGVTYDLTGPALLTFAEAVATMAAAAGRPIHFASIESEDFVAQLHQAGAPAEEIALLRHLFEELFDGRNASVSSDVAAVLGRPARAFTTFAREAASHGVWREVA